MDQIVPLGCGLPDASTDERQYLWRRLMVDGRVEVVRYVKLAWVHGSAQLRRLASGCCVDGKIDAERVARSIQGVPLERLTHTIYFWAQVGKAPRAPSCPLCCDAPPVGLPSAPRPGRNPPTAAILRATELVAESRATRKRARALRQRHRGGSSSSHRRE